MNELLERTLARPAHEREEYLRHACAGDETLYGDVSRLVAARSAPVPETDPMARTAPVEDRRVGTLVKNRYRIRSRLGSGGVGVVYLAEDMNLMSRLVVVKFLHDHGSHPGRLLKFLQEAEALARLDHPGIVAAFDADETPEGAHFLVMQYVDGRTLRAVLDDGPLAIPRAASILRQLGSALKAAHDKGVIHRDLKPENIMLQKLGDGREIVKLIDFGVARVEASAVTSDTAIFGIAGTPSYMSPEHLSGKPVPESDIFSIGVIAFEMVTGKRPFTAKQPFGLREQQKQGIPRGAIRAIRPEVPAATEKAIRDALQFEASARPSNAQDLCDAIGLPMEGSSVELRPADQGVSRRVWLERSLAGLAVAGAGGSIWLYTRRLQSGPRTKLLGETGGGVDPASQGFHTKNDLQMAAIRNAERSGFDSIRLQSKDEGSYVRRLSEEDLREALRLGWKITLKGRPLIGGMWACADFQALGEPRYDVSFYREPDGRAVALLCTQHAPTFDGPRYEMPDQGAKRHLLELVYDPSSRTCDLFVDGRRQAAGYKGHRQQQARDPLEAFYFGISVYRSDRAEAEVESVRYEIL